MTASHLTPTEGVTIRKIPMGRKGCPIRQVRVQATDQDFDTLLSASSRGDFSHDMVRFGEHTLVIEGRNPRQIMRDAVRLLPHFRGEMDVHTPAYGELLRFHKPGATPFA